jgi:hypothetical protein
VLTPCQECLLPIANGFRRCRSVGRPDAIDSPNVTHARSRGTVLLRSRDFRDKPCVDPRYFTDPEGHDLNPNITVMLVGERCAELVAGAQ